MGLKSIFVTFLTIGLLTSGALIIWQYLQPPPKAPVLQDGWYGRGDGKNYQEDTTIYDYQINVSSQVLKELQTRLKSTKYAEPLENVQFQYGFNQNYLRQVVDYWLNKYTWKDHEARLNAYPHYQTEIEGIKVHFLVARPKQVPKNVKVLPLLMVHGWPGSIVEFLSILPILTTPKNGIVFEVVCPSIPGYGFSEAPHQPGFGQVAAAQVFDKLMRRLGFSTYYAQGGDWGAVITTHMGALYPQRVKGLHVNMMAADLQGSAWFWLLLGQYVPWLVVDSKDYNKVYPLKDQVFYILRESGYMHLQATKPDTVGTALLNSPAGLAAYILEKFSTWTDKAGTDREDGALTKKFPLDDLLTNVMVYWVTDTITSSVRFYKEHFSATEIGYDMAKLPVHVPSGIAAFPNELVNLPQFVAETKYRKIVSFTDMPRGGHFAAMEEPQLLADDVFKFVSIVENSQ